MEPKKIILNNKNYLHIKLQFYILFVFPNIKAIQSQLDSFSNKILRRFRSFALMSTLNDEQEDC